MPNPFKETNMFEPVNGTSSIYGRILKKKFPTGTNPDPYEVDPLPVAELEMEDPLSAEYRYYDEPLAQYQGDEGALLEKTRPVSIK